MSYAGLHQPTLRQIAALIIAELLCHLLQQRDPQHRASLPSHQRVEPAATLLASFQSDTQSKREAAHIVGLRCRNDLPQRRYTPPTTG